MCSANIKHEVKESPISLKFAEEKNISPEDIRASLNFDPIGYKTVTGNCYNTNKCNGFEILKSMFEIVKDKYPNIKILNINGLFFRNSGSTAVQELAFSMNMAVEYLSKGVENGISAEKLIPHIMFTFGIGSQYFMEIAKNRAARVLWAKITEQYCPENTEIGKMYIHSVTCDWNKTAYDAYVNVLRTTTEAMSAMLGGTDSITIKPFDSTFKKENEFSERIARNTSVILKEEAYFDKTVDVSAGSYYIENLTDSIIENAWKLFLEIENEGGYLETLKKGIIQTQIEEIARKRDMNIAQKREILLGTNQYPNSNETISENIDEFIYNWELPAENPDTKPIKFYRGAKAF